MEGELPNVYPDVRIAIWILIHYCFLDESFGFAMFLEGMAVGNVIC